MTAPDNERMPPTAASERFIKEAMVKEHKYDIKAFEKASKNTQDPAKSFAAETLPTLRKHLQTAEFLAKAR
jgi:putative membrane protein